ncbi:hypothetical protein TERG_03876 [Paecilomyces variotii No. 5]|uniref:Aminoglycoside phosphotransferase domain-containing protein n=1 Tax=Byssochlamys spectabilis (strain No. 5 / NBRC 109023) TaxID=1356009 RepID=V5FZX3_BYSSN|nr:hypothetical protein TERG_03876 [Paecilomyces variotii No. 5]
MSTTDRAVDIISSANLSPTEHLILKGFIHEAVDPEIAAKHLVSRTTLDGQSDIEASLRDFKRDWRKLAMRTAAFDPIPEHLTALVRMRDGPRCSITKDSRSSSVVTTEAVYVIPPSLFHGLEEEEEGRLFLMLEAHITPTYVEKLRLQLSNQEKSDTDDLKNLWLLSGSIHKAFRQGHVAVTVGYRQSSDAKSMDERGPDATYKLETMYPEEMQGLVLGDGTALESTRRFRFCTPNAEILPIPSFFLFGTHRRLAAALHLFYIEDKIARGWPQPPRDILAFDFPIIRQVFYRLWLYVPLRIRHQCYVLLRKVGRRLYGPTMAACVHRLPFGLILKQCVRSQQNELASLRLVEQCTSIPAPRVVDVGEYDGITYLVMSRLRGQMLHETPHLLSYAERNRLADDLGSCISQLRRIPNPTEFLFCSALGGPVFDHRIPNGTGGPFNSEAEFNDHLTSHLQCTSAEVLGEENVQRGHRSYFSHCDFHPTNILLDRGRLGGIVDWGCGGYMPEYWEFTKAMYGTLRNPILESIFRRAFGCQYESELEVERKLWRYTPFGV